MTELEKVLEAVKETAERLDHRDNGYTAMLTLQTHLEWMLDEKPFNTRPTDGVTK